MLSCSHSAARPTAERPRAGSPGPQDLSATITAMSPHVEPCLCLPAEELEGLRDYLILEISQEQHHDGEPRLAVERVFESLATQIRLKADAMATISNSPMLTDREAAATLSVDRNTIDSLRCSSTLLALPSEDGYRYPLFQFDTDRSAVHDSARVVNEMLNAKTDPWGAAGWWLFPHDRLGARPADIVASSQLRLVAAAKAVTEPVG